jgi:uncharacterized DUF497 family protein
VSFDTASRAFSDTKRIILPDILHSQSEKRQFCLGVVDGMVITVRFTIRKSCIRIIGAGYWCKGKKYYEEINGV